MGSGGQGVGRRSLRRLQLGFQALGSGEASPARKPLRRCPHYITDIPATEPASLLRGASLNAKQDEAPSGRAAEPAEPLFSAAAGGLSGAGGRFQTPRPGQPLDAGRTRAAEGPGEGRRRARG